MSARTGSAGLLNQILRPTGLVYDIAPVGWFSSSLNRHSAIADVREYVAVYYNSKHLHATLGYKTTMNNEKNVNKVSEICCPLQRNKNQNM